MVNPILWYGMDINLGIFKFIQISGGGMVTGPLFDDIAMLSNGDVGEMMIGPMVMLNEGESRFESVGGLIVPRQRVLRPPHPPDGPVSLIAADDNRWPMLKLRHPCRFTFKPRVEFNNTSLLK
ncbi:MAG: hypothetical protein Ct9H90mP16_12420 [Candidatus Poseidoniales archaeon]|nr:MAG: hypothetical protein Ct9H90mP16_12420 [Candidatus Poseidoniales archaeon]